MYNESFKKMFLNTAIGNEDWYIPCFNTFEPYENEYGKDLSNFSTSQILGVYKAQNTTSIDYLYNLNIRMYKYTQFALMQNIVRDGQNHFDEISQDIIVKCLDQKGVEVSFISRERLNSFTSKLQNPMDKYIFYALYDGLKGNDYEEITSLTVEDINEKNKTAVLCTGRKVFVSQELINIAKESAETYRYYAYIVSNNTNRDEFSYELVGSGAWKLKNRKDMSDSQRQRGRGVYRIMQKCLDYVYQDSSYISGQSLHDSGCIDYINRIAKQNNISGEEVLYRQDLLTKVVNQYNIVPPRRKNLIRKYGEFLV